MFKWVHVSDLHFHSDDGFTPKTIKSELLETIKAIHDVNALIISGDFRYAKSGSTSAEEPGEYIKQLASSLKIGIDAVFCVPGNHDLDRSNKRSILVEGVAGDGKDKKGCYSSQDGRFDEGILKDLSLDFKYFVDLERILHGKDVMTEYNEIHRVVELQECNLLLLNTSILAHSDSDRGNLLLGIWYLQAALEKLNTEKPTLMVGHHGHSFLEREEAKAIQPLLTRKGISIYLCGHEHALFDESVWDNITQFTSGCIWNQGMTNIDSAGFYVGEIKGNIATMTAYEWRNKEHIWAKSPVPAKSVEANHIATSKTKKASKIDYSETVEKDVRLAKLLQENVPYPIDFNLDGYTLLGARGKEGIKYYWVKSGDRVESLAFNHRQNDPHPDNEIRIRDENISAYTASTSFGCILSASNRQCRFCESGTREFRGLLTAEEIAFQNIFMAGYDSNCPSFPEVRNHKREFAFMGQGEPGYSYSVIRRAILLTDCAMDALGQEIYRYVISTCGISEFMGQLIHDVENGVFENRIAIHYSLHLVDSERKLLMPIEEVYPYKKFLNLCKKYQDAVTKKFGEAEKIGVGIITFQNFQPNTRAGEQEINPITLNEARLDRILSVLDPSIFRIDLSEFNHTQTATRKSGEMSNEQTQKLLSYVRQRGFEAKTFSSFGNGKEAGCGMLKSASIEVAQPGATTLAKLDEALRLLNYSVSSLG